MREKHTYTPLSSVLVLAALGFSMAFQHFTVRVSAAQQPPNQQPSAQQGAVPQNAPPAGVRGTTEGAGSTIFGNYCENCHGKIETAISPASMKKMTPEHIYEVLTTGAMVPMAKDLTDQQKRDIAEWVGGRKLDAGAVGDASKMPNQCSTSADVKDLTSVPSWNGWSPGHEGRSLPGPQTAAGITADKISTLHLSWAFALPGADSVYGQPTVVDGKVYVSSDAGFIYSLDAKTGCVHWSYPVGIGVRSAVVIGPIKPGSTRYAAFFGDVRGNVYAVDANTGTLIWKVAIDRASAVSHYRRNHALRRPIVRPGCIAGRTRILELQLSMLHFPRDGCGAGFGYGQADMEDLRSS